MKPIWFDEFVNSATARQEAWRRAFSGTAGWTGAVPNQGHHAIARLLEAGQAELVITQNVDNLHQDAGAPTDKVIELHGNASFAACLECRTRYELHDLRARWEEGALDMICDACGGLIKTAVISFGQPLPEHAYQRAKQAALASDLFLVLGSSLVVYPAASLPALAKAAGAGLVIVNRDATKRDADADLVVRDEIGPFMSEVLRQL